MSQAILKHSIKVPRLYKSAAKVLIDVKAGGNIKTLIKEINHPNKRGIMALVIKTLQHMPMIDKLFNHTGILEKEATIDKDLTAILTTELLWGKKLLQGDSKPIQTVLRYEDEFLNTLKTEDICEAEEIVDTIWRPRYVRVNTIKQNTDAVINYFTKRAWKCLTPPDGSYHEYIDFIKYRLQEGYFTRDYHLDDMLLFPQGTVFARNKLYVNGGILLQDKSSSMAVHLLAPEPGSTVLDMCAAPGMKTSHIAAFMKNEGKVYAVDHDEVRHRTLLETIKRCNLKCVKPYWADILKLKRLNNEEIEYIALDPSCSGSGMLSRLAYEKIETDEKRLKRLSNLQGKLLRHALTNFPSVKRVVYSTCSVHAQENEAVIDEALTYASNFKLIDCAKKFKQWFNFGLPEYKSGPQCIRAVPSADCMNGFFIAAFERVDKSS